MTSRHRLSDRGAKPNGELLRPPIECPTTRIDVHSPSASIRAEATPQAIRPQLDTTTEVVWERHDLCVVARPSWISQFVGTVEMLP